MQLLILENISKEIDGNVLINMSPSKIFLSMLLPMIFHHNCQAAFGRHCEY